MNYSYTNRFFGIVNKAYELKNWVDIENEYYRQLTEISQKGNNKEPQQLDWEFEAIKTKLISYLTKIQNERICSGLKNTCIEKAIYEPFDIRDISNHGMKNIQDFLRLKIDKEDSNIEDIQKNYGRHSLFSKLEIVNYLNGIIDISDPTSDYIETPYDLEKHLSNIQNKSKSVPDYFLLPDQILFLNFNYTKMADQYIPQGSEFKVNHIHGELGNDKNPIIFGYGDELDDDYKEISKLNDNDYLKNIKSIRYLETDNYRKLLSFIDSAPFQIYIMGHSCGNSDRTLLNTLFEHRNCVSIKPFYYEKPDGTDNYIEIIQNISRNFNDMRLMRDRVVNKTYCRPLVPQAR